VIPELDYVEAWNARLMVGDGNSRAAEFAKDHNLPGVAASDSHTVMEVGVAYTVFDGPIDTADEFRAALAAGPRLVTSHGSRLIRLGMPFAKVVQRVRGNRRVAVS
jgi:predicted metal-dependent phosphoesterase TrpH